MLKERAKVVLQLRMRKAMFFMHRNLMTKDFCNNNKGRKY